MPILLTRFLLSLLGALVASGALFTLMQVLTTSRGLNLGTPHPHFAMEFVRLQRETPPQVRQREIPQKPPPPKEPPPPPKLAVESTEAPQSQPLDFRMPNLAVSGVSGGEGPWMGGFTAGGGDQMGDSDLIPIARISPQYPQQAALNGIEGFVRFSITVAPDGSVINASISEASHPMFRQPALRAVYRWKFRPKVVDGQPVQTEGFYKMDFELSPTP